MILPLPNFSSYTRVVSTLHCTTKSDFPQKKTLLSVGFLKDKKMNYLFIYLFLFFRILNILTYTRRENFKKTNNDI